MEVKEEIQVGRKTTLGNGEPIYIGVTTAGVTRLISDEIVLILGAGAGVTIAYTVMGLAARVFQDGSSSVGSTARRRK